MASRMVRFAHRSGEAVVNPSRVAFVASNQTIGRYDIDIGFHHRGRVHMQRFQVQDAAAAGTVLGLIQTAFNDDRDDD